MPFVAVTRRATTSFVSSLLLRVTSPVVWSTVAPSTAVTACQVNAVPFKPVVFKSSCVDTFCMSGLSFLICSGNKARSIANASSSAVSTAPLSAMAFFTAAVTSAAFDGVTPFISATS